MSVAVHLPICHRCPRMSKECDGPCACTADGRDIIEHANRGDCPEGRYADVYSRPTMPIPDDYKPTPANATAGGCGCAGDQQRKAAAHVVVPPSP